MKQEQFCEGYSYVKVDRWILYLLGNTKIGWSEYSENA